MKLNKRLKSSITQTFFFNLVLLIFLVGVTVFSLWPSFLEIESQKDTLSTNYTELEQIKKQGIAIKDFKIIAWETEMDQYLKELVKNTGEPFYSRNFKNTERTSFDLFIEDKSEAIAEEQKQLILEEKNDVVDTLLPIYTSDESSENALTDFRFINYVESVLYAFNLVSTDSIWVWELEKVDNQDVDNQTSLDSNIFYIPLRLELTGQKSDILDFIHYFENVGSIDLKDDNVMVYQDKVISKTFPWEITSSDGNLYEHQFSDIEKISMDTYIDSSSSPVRWDFAEFIKTTQKREKFSIEVDLRFYVQWLPDYKIESYIKGVLDLHAELTKSSQRALKLSFDSSAPNTSDSLKAKNAVRSLSGILEMMGDDVKKLRVSFSKKDKDLLSLYNLADQYNRKLRKIEEVLQESMVTLNSKK